VTALSRDDASRTRGLSRSPRPIINFFARAGSLLAVGFAIQIPTGFDRRATDRPLNQIEVVRGTIRNVLV
jgi:hypothetical protein